VTPCFHRGVADVFALLRCYTAFDYICLPSFRNTPYVSSSRHL